MIRIIFITILFFSSNVFAATYLVCKNTKEDTVDIISIKLLNKPSFLCKSNPIGSNNAVVGL